MHFFLSITSSVLASLKDRVEKLDNDKITESKPGSQEMIWRIDMSQWNTLSQSNPRSTPH